MDDPEVQVESAAGAAALLGTGRARRRRRPAGRGRVRRRAGPGRRLAGRISDDSRKVLLNKGQELTEEDLDQLPMAYWSEIRVDNESVETELGR